MKRADISRDANCNKKVVFDVPEALNKLARNEKKKLGWNTEFPNCANIANKYDMVNLLGQGTYGIVYKARERGTNTYVALKKVTPNTVQGGVPLTAIREIRILQQLKHENVICFIEVCKAKITGSNELSVFYIALEYCEFSLERLLKEKQVWLTLGAKKTILKHLLNGLYFMQQNCILHRDIKPANLLISKGGVLKIADFGLARSIYQCATNEKQVFSGRVVTLWYRAPELLLGERSYSTAIDMWSAGCVMAELWTRSAIMNGSSEQEQLFLILKLCGSITKGTWLNVEKLPLYTKMELPTHYRRRLREIFGKVLTDMGAMSLLDRILTLDPAKRIDANQAMNHEFFWGQPLPESLTSILTLYRKIQMQPKVTSQKEQYSGYVDHIF